MDQNQRTYWPMMCESIQSHARAMGRLGSQFGADLMIKVAERFCALPEPTTAVEISARQRDQITVGGIIGTLAHAESMAQLTPNAGPEISVAMKSFAERDFVDQGAMQQMQFASSIALICYRHD